MARRREPPSISGAAWRLLSVRDRSREELRLRLLRKGLDALAVETELDRLQELGYLDDTAFSQTWVATRQAGSMPRSSAALRSELRRKGVDAAIVSAALAASDDAGAVHTVAQRRAAALSQLPYPEFRRRLFAYLQRRGFGHELCREAVDAAWLGRRGSAPDESELP